MEQLNISKSFKLSLINIGLVLIFYITALVADQSKDSIFITLLIGLPLMIAGFLALIGLARIYVGRKEVKNYKFFFSIIIHGPIAVLWIYAWVVTIKDLSRLF